MSFLSGDEIAAMASVVLQAMPDTCVIQGSSYGPDGAGGGTIVWTPVTGGTVACRCDSVPNFRGGIEVAAGAEGDIYDFIFTLPVTAPIATGRKIVHAGHIYDIRGMGDDPSWVLCHRAYCKRVSNVGD